ncbi:hypothetical protein [Accumulibacter sp.]|uniref:hypothetical protein n=1 Tax=Accumulibacter sp. TaxID=2053492 RepID=UPI001E15622E|nr:hypothetical protein [Accumulibacter sp.]MCB1966983.1 hypothetical protein [Accumulibacter sp.]MCP5229948.1 hypothetical protein [Accumulibacter sp.]
MIRGRRQFIQSGLAGGLLLSLSGWLNAAGPRPFSEGEREMLAALVAAMLAGVLPNEEPQRSRLVAETVDGVATAVSGLSLASQDEIGELFGLLVVAPGRVLLAGVGRPWREASVAEVGDFLQSWRSSRLNLFQSAYGALHDLIFGAWYGRPANWQAISYPGPPRGYF